MPIKPLNVIPKETVSSFAPKKPLQEVTSYIRKKEPTHYPTEFNFAVNNNYMEIHSTKPLSFYWINSVFNPETRKLTHRGMIVNRDTPEDFKNACDEFIARLTKPLKDGSPNPFAEDIDMVQEFLQGLVK
ncbi:MAG: hypothetical protein MJ237_08730 [bacterium]|nr:hypothetical protein [bacterium]